MYNAIILAGIETAKAWDGPDNKALFRINGKMMVEYVIEALRNSAGLEKTFVVGPKNQLEPYLGSIADGIIDSDGSIIDKVAAGISHSGYEKDVLICCSDIPLVTPQAINDFVAKSKALQADFCYPIVEKRVNEEKFPEIERTYVKIKDGVFTGGNIFYLNPKVLEKVRNMADMFLNARKNPLKMARLLGIYFMLKFMTGSLTINEVENKVSCITGVKARAVVSEYPEIGNDVDKPSDVIIATAHLSS